MSKKINVHAGRYFGLVAAAVVVNVVLFLIGQASGATYDVKAQSTVNLGIVVGMTVAQLSVGFVLAWLVARFAPKFFGALVWVGVGFAIITAPGGWVASQDPVTGITLGLMHVSGAAAWFLGVKNK